MITKESYNRNIVSILLFILEFILFISLIYLTIPIYKENYRSKEYYTPNKVIFPIILNSVGIILLYIFNRRSVVNKIRLENGKLICPNHFFYLFFSFIAKIPLIVFSAYIGFYFIQNFGYILNFKLQFLSIIVIVLIALFLFSEDFSTIANIFKR